MGTVNIMRVLKGKSNFLFGVYGSFSLQICLDSYYKFGNILVTSNSIPDEHFRPKHSPFTGTKDEDRIDMRRTADGLHWRPLPKISWL